MHYAISFAPQHRLKDHLESPDRVLAAERALLGAASRVELIPIETLPSFSAIELIEATNTHTYLASLINKARENPTETLPIADVDDPDGVTYLCGEATVDAALRAVNLAVAVTESTIQFNRPGISLTRPPGHHATTETPLGYCIFNNVALAALHARRQHGMKVMIIDFDVHHGNGTQEIMYTDKNMLFLDIHESSAVYPCPPYARADFEETGGCQNVINVPLPRFAGRHCMALILDKIVAPAARRFKPDLILTSAGFDGHFSDPFNLLQYTRGTFHDIAFTLRELSIELCQGRLAMVLEGGYAEKGIEDGVTGVVLALSDVRLPLEEMEKAGPHAEPLKEVEDLVDALKSLHGL